MLFCSSFSSPPFPSSSFLSSSLSLLFPFFLLSLSLLLFLFCTSLLIPFPPSFLKYFFGLCSIFLLPISFWSLRLSFSFSHFCFFCYSFIKILLWWVSDAPFQILVSLPLSCSLFTLRFPPCLFPTFPPLTHYPFPFFPFSLVLLSHFFFIISPFSIVSTFPFLISHTAFPLPSHQLPPFISAEFL